MYHHQMKQVFTKTTNKKQIKTCNRATINIYNTCHKWNIAINYKVTLTLKHSVHRNFKIK